MGGGRKKMLQNEKYWNNPSIYDIMHCTVSCWTLGEYCDREYVINRGKGINLIKAQYIQIWSTKLNPLLDYQYIFYFKKWRAGGKNKSFPGVDTSERGMGTKKGGMRVYMIEILCTHIWKQKNKTCWNCSKKGEGGKRKNDGGG
jgi:hypothetical protein